MNKRFDLHFVLDFLGIRRTSVQGSRCCNILEIYLTKKRGIEVRPDSYEEDDNGVSIIGGFVIDGSDFVSVDLRTREFLALVLWTER